jgi:Tfp pilus assembly protein PilN
MRAVNLIPKEQRGGTSVGAGRSEGAAYAVLGVIAVIAVLALLYGQAHHQLTSRTSEATKLTAQAQKAQAEASQLAPYTSFVQLREQRQQAVSTLVDSRFDWAHAFHELGRVLTAETAISSLTGSIVGATAPAAGSSTTPAGSVPTFTLQGCAKSQRAVALALERLRLIDGVNEVTLQSSTRGGSTGSGGCSGPSFSTTITFDALPSTSAAAAVAKPTSSTKTVSEAASPSAATAAPAPTQSGATGGEKR